MLLSFATPTANHSQNGNCDNLQVRGIKSEYLAHDTLEVSFQNTGKDVIYFIAYLQFFKKDEGKWYQIDGGLEKIGSERTQIHELRAHKSRKFKIDLYKWLGGGKFKEKSFRTVYKFRYDIEGGWECVCIGQPFIVKSK